MQNLRRRCQNLRFSWKRLLACRKARHLSRRGTRRYLSRRGMRRYISRRGMRRYLSPSGVRLSCGTADFEVLEICAPRAREMERYAFEICCADGATRDGTLRVREMRPAVARYAPCGCERCRFAARDGATCKTKQRHPTEVGCLLCFTRKLQVRRGNPLRFLRSCRAHLQALAASRPARIVPSR